LSFHTSPPLASMQNGANYPPDAAGPVNVPSPSPVQSAPRRRLPKREMWLPLTEVTENPYFGFEILARVRYEDTLNDDLASGNFQKIRGALKQIVLAHNDWLDADTGEPLPPARAADGSPAESFWAKMAQEEVLLMLRVISDERGKVLTSIMRGKES
jgi:hypothetical protein